MIAMAMVNATIGRDLTRHNDQAMALPEKLTAGRDAEKDMKEIMFATCYIGSL